MNGERGSMVLAMMALVLLGALGASLGIIANTEMKVAGNYALAQEALYAAEAGLEIVSQELGGTADWLPIPAGQTRSAFVDGLPGGTRELSDGTVVNLADVTAGLDNRGWRLFAFGPLGRLQDPDAWQSPAYIVVWVAGDPAGEPSILVVRVEAYATGGTRRAVEAVISQAQGLLSWNEVR